MAQRDPAARRYADAVFGIASDSGDAAAFDRWLTDLDDIAQLQTELVGLYTFFNYTEHVVNEHGERDGGRVLLTRALLDATWQRYIDVADSGS